MPCSLLLEHFSDDSYKFILLDDHLCHFISKEVISGVFWTIINLVKGFFESQENAIWKE